jgi:hypothetical protein
VADVNVPSCAASADVDVATGNAGVLACWLPAGHDGPHWDEADGIEWMLIDPIQGNMRATQLWGC